MVKRKRNEFGFASLVFVLYMIFPANLSFGQGFGGFGGIQGRVTSPFGQYNNYSGGNVGFGATSPNYGPLTFRYPIENVIASQFPGEFVVNSVFGTPRPGVGIGRKSGRGNRR